MWQYSQLDFLTPEEEQDLQQRMVNYRRAIHVQPEIGLQEFLTSQYIVNLLQTWGFEEIHTGLAGTGVVAVIRGETDESILIRADMDGLPIQEDSGEPFQSRVRNMMHACGHDGHVAILLGTAYQMIKQIKNGLVPKRGIKFCFQPGEENVRGAKKMLEDNAVYDVLLSEPKVKHCFGLHLGAGIKCHQIGYHTGSFCANSDRWEIHIKGVGGHCSQPELTVDALQIAVNVSNSIYQLRGRNMSQSVPCTVTIGKVLGGQSYNVITDTATICGNCRTKSKQDQTTIFTCLQNFCKAAEIHFPGSKVEFVYVDGNRLIENNIDLEPFVLKALSRVGPITPQDLVLGGEDFSEFSDLVPSAFLVLGASPVGQEGTISHHSPTFKINEDAFLTGAKIWLSILQDWLSL